MKTIKRFEIGKEYATCSPCNSDCIIAVKVLRRTASTVTIEMLRGGIGMEKIRTFRINQKRADLCGEEMFQPWGAYSMSPIISAGRAA